MPCVEHTAFQVARSPLPSHKHHRKCKCSRRPSTTSLYFGDERVPVGTLIAAGVSLGITAATFENMIKVVYTGRGRARRRPSEDELCQFCSGFGTVRCELCASRGVLTIMGTSKQRVCPLCKGERRERCRRCAGTGKSGMKKQAVRE